MYLTEKIPVKTYYGRSGWVQFRRGECYRELIDLNSYSETNSGGFKTVSHIKKSNVSIYYWHLYAHNLFPLTPDQVRKDVPKNEKYLLYLCQMDYRIFSNDNQAKYAYDPQQPNMVLPVYFYVKYDKIKFKPISFLATSPEEIKWVLQMVSYVVVQEIRDGYLQIVSPEPHELPEFNHPIQDIHNRSIQEK